MVHEFATAGTLNIEGKASNSNLSITLVDYL